MTSPKLLGSLFLAEGTGCFVTRAYFTCCVCYTGIFHLLCLLHGHISPVSDFEERPEDYAHTLFVARLMDWPVDQGMADG